jgi:hypothetical protein
LADSTIKGQARLLEVINSYIGKKPIDKITPVEVLIFAVSMKNKTSSKPQKSKSKMRPNL